ncbi:NADH-quinone oxidoreductase subunit L [Marinomonas pollencensis]|uniref:Probable inorganic carbon transporter subunit DabB n=1 Tax=Marinomonas pollencensis TaxID=491954 RepID=A0A3E0DMJ2_9GAMM|nr:NADH-quinone oxidoreductase subunit L [Marinomonas pollencensis]REG83332.1 NAD(P)H-quinone oxidoreductase subunit 5 [Marinomonas pollencensis]
MPLVTWNLLPVLIPIALILCGLLGCREKSTSVAQTAVWLSRGLLCLYGLNLAAYFFLSTPEPAQQLLRHTELSQIMLALIVIMSWVLFRFSRNYMNGQANLPRYYRWLMFTLASVAVTVMSNHLVLFWLGWFCISLSLHNLLTFFPDRPRAILAAHKKFILARIAELTLLIAFVLLYQQHQSVYISSLLSSLTEPLKMGQPLAWQDQLAACLIALAALIKCAQLPFHGWLIQVVESPTPVSALLHAGVINLGGYMLLLFAPLVSQSAPAIWLLLIVAGLSTLASSLVMTTRISVKVRLAWSTSAQMGLMLLEFALGLYELVLLHLLAHSFYKAYSFLNSSNAINDYLRLALCAPTKYQANKPVFPTMKDWSLALIIATFCVVAVRFAFHFDSAFSTWWLFALALSILLVQWRSSEHSVSWLRSFVTGLALTLIYAALKSLMWFALPAETNHVAAFSYPDIWAMSLFTLLFTINLLLHYQIHWPWVRRLSMTLFAGLYLDEWVTRAVLKIWPVTLPARSKQKHSTSPSQLSLPKHY